MLKPYIIYMGVSAKLNIGSKAIKQRKISRKTQPTSNNQKKKKSKSTSFKVIGGKVYRDSDITPELEKTFTQEQEKKKGKSYKVIRGKVYRESEVTEKLQNTFINEQIRKIEKSYDKIIKPSRGTRFVVVDGKTKNYEKLTQSEKINFYSKNFPEQIFQVGSKTFTDRTKAESYIKKIQTKEIKEQNLRKNIERQIKRQSIYQEIDIGTGIPLSVPTRAIKEAEERKAQIAIKQLTGLQKLSKKEKEKINQLTEKEKKFQERGLKFEEKKSLLKTKVTKFLNKPVSKKVREQILNIASVKTPILLKPSIRAKIKKEIEPKTLKGVTDLGVDLASFGGTLAQTIDGVINAKNLYAKAKIDPTLDKKTLDDQLKKGFKGIPKGIYDSLRPDKPENWANILLTAYLVTKLVKKPTLRKGKVKISSVEKVSKALTESQKKKLLSKSKTFKYKGQTLSEIKNPKVFTKAFKKFQKQTFTKTELRNINRKISSQKSTRKLKPKTQQLTKAESNRLKLRKVEKLKQLKPKIKETLLEELERKSKNLNKIKRLKEVKKDLKKQLKQLKKTELKEIKKTQELLKFTEKQVKPKFTIKQRISKTKLSIKKTSIKLKEPITTKLKLIKQNKKLKTLIKQAKKTQLKQLKKTQELLKFTEKQVKPKFTIKQKINKRIKNIKQEQKAFQQTKQELKEIKLNNKLRKERLKQANKAKPSKLKKLKKLRKQELKETFEKIKSDKKLQEQQAFQQTKLELKEIKLNNKLRKERLKQANKAKPSKLKALNKLRKQELKETFKKIKSDKKIKAENKKITFKEAQIKAKSEIKEVELSKKIISKQNKLTPKQIQERTIKFTKKQLSKTFKKIKADKKIKKQQTFQQSKTKKIKSEVEKLKQELIRKQVQEARLKEYYTITDPITKEIILKVGKQPIERITIPKLTPKTTKIKTKIPTTKPKINKKPVLKPKLIQEPIQSLSRRNPVAQLLLKEKPSPVILEYAYSPTTPIVLDKASLSLQPLFIPAVISVIPKTQTLTSRLKIFQLPELKPKTNILSKSKIISLEKVKLKTKTLEKIKTDTLTKEKVKYAYKYKYKYKVAEKEAIAEKEATAILETPTIQEQKLKIKEIEEIPVKKIKKPIFIPIPLPKVKKVKTSKSGFTVLLKSKKNKKYKPVTQDSFTKIDAKALGRYLVDNSLKASFKIQKTETLINKKVVYGNKNKFRESKRNPMIKVEKRGKRLDTIGEIKDIRVARLLSKAKVNAKPKRTIRKPINALKGLKIKAF